MPVVRARPTPSASTPTAARSDVDLARAASYFPAVAAVPSLAVVPESIDELARGPRRDMSFAASGAYVPVGGEPGELWLRANDAYWAGPPSMERISVVTDLGGRSEVDVFEDGAVDWIRISPLDAAWIRYDQVLGPQLRHADEMVVEYLGFDTSRPPFDDPGVRRAVSMAVDWARLAAHDPSGTPAVTTIVPPGVEARGDGRWAAAVRPGGGSRRAGRGRLSRVARASRPSRWRPTASARRPPSPRSWSASWASTSPSRSAPSMTIRHCSTATRPPCGRWPGAPTIRMRTTSWGCCCAATARPTSGGWANAAYDDLIDTAAATADPAEQAALYEQAQAIVRDEVPLIPLSYGDSWALSREGLRGAAVSGVGLLRFADLAWQS